MTESGFVKAVRLLTSGGNESNDAANSMIKKETSNWPEEDRAELKAAIGTKDINKSGSVAKKLYNKNKNNPKKEQSQEQGQEQNKSSINVDEINKMIDDFKEWLNTEDAGVRWG